MVVIKLGMAEEEPKCFFVKEIQRYIATKEPNKQIIIVEGTECIFPKILKKLGPKTKYSFDNCSKCQNRVVVMEGWPTYR